MIKLNEFEIGYFDRDGAHAAVHQVAADEEDAIRCIHARYGIKRTQIWSIVNRTELSQTLHQPPNPYGHTIKVSQDALDAARYSLGSLAGAVKYSAKCWKAECDHEWYCDYQSMFDRSMDKYSCKKCKVKKEDV